MAAPSPALPAEAAVTPATPKPPAKKRHPGKAILAGGISGGLEILLTFPTEYVKTQLQLDERSAKPRFNGPVHCVKLTVKEHGVMGLYRGLSSLLYGSIPKSAVRFGAFEQFKRMAQGPDGKMTPGKQFLCGLGAGVSEAIFAVCPMETVKVKFIHDQTSANPRFKGFAHGVRTIVAEEGFRGVYKGLFPTILKQGSNQGIRFLVYDQLLNLMGKGKPGDKPTKSVEMARSVVAGALAGAASVFGNTPIDVVKTRLQGLDSHKYTGTLDCIQKIWKNEGFKAFYKGTTPRLGRVCADVAFVMTFYEQTMVFLDWAWKTD